MRVSWSLCVSYLAALAVTSQPGTAQEKIDRTKIVGVWEVVKVEWASPGTTFEFSQDGKLLIRLGVEGKTGNVEGTYAIKGEVLTLKIIDFRGEDLTEVYTIKTLTAEKLELLDKRKQENTFKKKKK
jgi:uncharacterized protein (TIGR03066 family)